MGVGEMGVGKMGVGEMEVGKMGIPCAEDSCQVDLQAVEKHK